MTKIRCTKCGEKFDIPTDQLSVNCACGAAVENPKAVKSKTTKTVKCKTKSKEKGKEK